MRGRHLHFEYVHSETGHVADSVDLKIGRSAVRSCNIAGIDSAGLGNVDESDAVLGKKEFEGSDSQEYEVFPRNSAPAPEPLGSASNIQRQRIAVQ